MFQSFVEEFAKTDTYDERHAPLECQFSMSSLPRSTFHSPAAFLNGKSAAALRDMQIFAPGRDGLPGAEAERNISFTSRGDLNHYEHPEMGRYFVDYRIYQTPDQLMELSSHGTELERLVDHHTVPMTRWDRFRGIPVVEKYSIEKIEDRQRDRRVKMWAWCGSAVISVVVTLVTALLANG